MRIGIIISIVIVLVFALYFIAASMHTADPPTDATSPEKLKKIADTDKLPKIYTSDDPNGNAGAAYQDVLKYYKENSAKINDDNPPTIIIEKLTTKVIDAMNAGQVPDGLLDDMIPLQPGAEPTYEDAIEVIPQKILDRSKKIWETGDDDRAVTSAKAVFAFGERLMTHSTRLWNRLKGLQMMIFALENLFEYQDRIDELKKSVPPWVEYAKAARAAWDPKVQLVMSMSPEIGDLINIAENDKDKTFRIEAILRIGMRKFNAETKGNEYGMKDALEHLKNDPDDMIKQAAQAADDFTADQLKKVH